MVDEEEVNPDYTHCNLISRLDWCYTIFRQHIEVDSWQILFEFEYIPTVKMYVCQGNSERIQNEKMNLLLNSNDCIRDNIVNLPACQAVHLDGIESNSAIYTMMDEFLLCYKHLSCPGKEAVIGIVKQAAKRFIDLLP